MYTAAKVRFSFFAATLASIFCLAICLRVLRSCAVHNLIVFLRLVFFDLTKIASLSLRRTKGTLENRKGQLDFGPPLSGPSPLRGLLKFARGGLFAISSQRATD